MTAYLFAAVFGELDPVTAYWFSFVSIAGLLLVVILGVFISSRQVPLELTVLEDGDPTTLHYCYGCGCNHRREWMDWDEFGRYRCQVCCPMGEIEDDEYWT